MYCAEPISFSRVLDVCLLSDPADVGLSVSVCDIGLYIFICVAASLFRTIILNALFSVENVIADSQ